MKELTGSINRTNELTTYGATSTSEEDEESKSEFIRVILESESWRFVGRKAHIGVYNKSGTPHPYTLKVTEMRDTEMLPPELLDKYMLFESIFKRTDASQISQNERKRHNVCDKTEFTYGEVLFPYFIPLLELAQPKQGEVFWDIGCGAGRPLAIAALNFP